MKIVSNFNFFIKSNYSNKGIQNIHQKSMYATNPYSFKGLDDFDKYNVGNTQDLNRFKDLIGNNPEIKSVHDAKRILEVIGYKDVQINENNLLAIEEYRQPSDSVYFSDLNIDENELVKYIQIIRGDADFAFSNLKSLGNIEKIGGSLDVSSNVNLAKLSDVKSFVDPHSSFAQAYAWRTILQKTGYPIEISDNDDRKKVFNALNIQYELDSDGEFIIDNFSVKHEFINSDGSCSILDFNKQDYIDISSLMENVKEIKRDCNINNFSYLDLSNIRKIGGELEIDKSHKVSLSALESVHNLNIRDSHLADLSSLKKCNEISIYSSYRTDLSSLEDFNKASIVNSSVFPSDDLFIKKDDIYFSNSRFYNTFSLSEMKNVSKIRKSCESDIVEYDIEVLKEKYNNGKLDLDDFEEIRHDMYCKYRKYGKYAQNYSNDISNEQVAKINILVNPMNPRSYRYTKSSKVELIKENPWVYRAYQFKSMLDIVDRISLNVKPHSDLIRNLDRFMVTGTYINSKGEEVKLDKYSKFYYKTPLEIEKWEGRQDPVTLYFDEDIDDNTLEAIRQITAPFARGILNESEVAKDYNWLLIENASVGFEIDILKQKALKANEIFGKYVASLGHSLTSNGIFKVCEAMTKEIEILKENGVVFE